MLAGDFQRKLRKLNPRLRIFCGNDDSKAAGIFTIENGEYEHICGVDKSYLPEWSFVKDNGMIVKGGFRRPLKILIEKGYIDRLAAQKLFNVRLAYKAPKRNRAQRESLEARLSKKYQVVGAS
jgi:hypothetical protein